MKRKVFKRIVKRKNKKNQQIIRIRPQGQAKESRKEEILKVKLRLNMTNILQLIRLIIKEMNKI